MGQIRPPFTADERRRFYLMLLGDAHYEGTTLHEALWAANTLYPRATLEDRIELAKPRSLHFLMTV